MATALIDAIHNSDVDLLVKLLAAGEDPDEVFIGFLKSLRSPLHEAAGGVASAASTDNNKEEVEACLDAVVVLLRHGAIVNDKDENRTQSPLLSAVHNNQLACARILLAAGADPNVYGNEGETALRLCAEFGHQEMARLLLRCGANVYRSGGADGMNALGFAASMLDVEMVRLFLAHGADPNVRDNDGETVFERLADFPIRPRPETPEKIERFREIRRLLGMPDT